MTFFIPGMMSYKPQEMFFQYASILFFVIGMMTPKLRDFRNKYLAFFFLYVFVQTILVYFHPTARLQLLNIFMFFITVSVMTERVRFRFKELGIWFLFFCLLNLGLVYLQSINQDPIFSSVNPQNSLSIEPCGFMGSRYALGALGAFAMPFIYVLNPWLCVVPLALVVLGKSSTVVLASFLGFMFLQWFDNKRLFWSLFILSVVSCITFVAFDFQTGQFELRLKTWREGLSYLAGTSPWIGNGLGSWANVGFFHVQENGLPKVWSWAHNELIQAVFELGFVVLFFIYFYFKDLLKRLNLRELKGRVSFCSMIILVIFSLFHFPFHVGRFAGITAFIFAINEAIHANKA